MQTKILSLVEVVTNVSIGFVGSCLLWVFLVAPMVGVEGTVTQSFLITSIFTVWSVLRGYCVRRIFNSCFNK